MAFPNNRRAFTLVEIMIVVTIIGLLAALAIPAFNRVRRLARITAFTNDLRIGKDAFETYALQKGTWPPDGAATMPAEMDGYLSPSKWSAETPLGGHWDWDFNQFGVTAGLSVYNPTADLATMRLVDSKIDDGDLATGNFRARTDGYVLILEL
jgi:prepilin-type N-terminal cleavage/methylation domain-containing protein